ncbi:MAG: hypothetical protein K2X01_07575 [Cyanobacteria bacterium]|nr:hypothetical protein [Cyanobacteriota bacterium]
MNTVSKNTVSNAVSSSISTTHSESEQAAVCTVQIGLGAAPNSAQALKLLELALEGLPTPTSGSVKIELETGNLLITPNVLTKIQLLVEKAGAELSVIYASLPQTQQAALDSGLFVKEKPPETKIAAQKAGGLSQKSHGTQPIQLFNERRGSVDELLGRSLSSLGQNSGINKDSLVSLPGEKPTEQAIERERDSQKTAEALSENTSQVIQSDVTSHQNDVQTVPTLYLKQNIRSGRVVRAEGHIFIIGDVHEGSEIVAGGDITVWGELRGIAHAGCQGEYHAEIRALRIEAIQLRIAEYIARRPDRVHYHKDVKDADPSRLGEVARVSDGEIQVFQEVTN